MDGVIYYHTGLEEKRSVELKKAVWYASQGDHRKVQRYLDVFGEKNCMINYIVAVQLYIMKKVAESDLKELLQFAYLLLRTYQVMEECKEAIREIKNF